MEEPLKTETPRFTLVQSILDRYTQLWPDPVEQSKLVKKYMTQELAEGKEGARITANPFQPGNTEYKRFSGFDREQFLRQRLQGRVIDIGSGGINELEGIVSGDQVVYVDSRPQQQRNFHQVSVGEEQLPFEDGSFDAAYSRNAMQEKEHARAIIPELLRVVKSGGNLVIELQYLPEGERRAILSIMEVLKNQGIDIDKQCELTIDEAYVQHNKYPLRFNQPTIFLTVKR